LGQCRSHADGLADVIGALLDFTSCRREASLEIRSRHL